MAKRVRKPDLDPEEFKNNPLVGVDFKILIRKLPSGLIEDGGVVVRNEVDVEQEHYTKLFHMSEMRKFVGGLKPSSKSLFLWLLYEVDCGKDYLWINKDRYMLENNVSSINTYKGAIKELSRYLFICPTSFKDVYFINPAIFFNGSRVNKYSDKVVEYKPKSKP